MSLTAGPAFGYGRPPSLDIVTSAWLDTSLSYTSKVRNVTRTKVCDVISATIKSTLWNQDNSIKLPIVNIFDKESPYFNTFIITTCTY